MLITAKRLKEILTILKPVMPKRGPLPVLSYALLGDGRAVATDLECCVVLDCPESTDAMLLPVKEVLDYLKAVPNTASLNIVLEGEVIAVSVVGNGASAHFTSLNTDDYPPVVKTPELAQIQIDGNWLVDTLSEAVIYSQKYDDRPVLHAVCLTLGEHKIRIAAADRFRLYVREIGGGIDVDANLIIPREAIPILKTLWDKHGSKQAISDSQITVSYNTERITFTFGNAILYSRLVQGTYPDYMRLIPITATSTIKLLAPDLELAVKQVSGVAKLGSGLVRLEWDGNQMLVSARQDDDSVSQSTIQLQTATDKGRIAANYTYLGDYCKGKPGVVEMSTTTVGSPIKFEDGKSVVVIMPMFAQWGE